MVMTKLMSALIALSVLSGAVTAVNAQTREDERRSDIWRQQQHEDRLP
jgi:hypothetical protein